ncbi:MAG TPA: hypothetical protein VET65_08045 [Candidatus Limnocylindrales bacterium]|nr:hypothetical protein [Candidatus Limnocylindrales bacterium]
MRRILFAAIALLLAGCSALSAPGASPTPSGSPSPTPAGSALSQVELKYRLLAQVGPIAYCDPDSYPVGRPVTPDYVRQRLLGIQSTDAQTYQDILNHYRLTGTLTDAQQLMVYTDYKRLAALRLTASGTGYDFDYFVGQGGNAPSLRTKGTIDQYGSISVASQIPGRFACPICLTAGTMIDTPNGAVPVATVKVGTIVWTVGSNRLRQAAPVLRVSSTPGGPGFLVHLTLADGRELWASPKHPLPDGRRVGDLLRGDPVDGSRVVLAQLLASSAATYDLLPAGATGAYWADGILLASTLHHS